MGDLPEDSELVSAALLARAGDTAAFRRVVELTHARVYRLAFRLLGDAGDAEDVAQEAYVRAWRHIGGLRRPEVVLAWLCRIARNLAGDRRRGRPRELALGLEELERTMDEREQALDERLAGTQLANAVRAAVESLPDKHRVLLLLREVDGMSYEDIAQVLDLPVGTVESRLHRARKALARRLSRWARREEGR